MSAVTYLLGAGASYGVRDKETKSGGNMILRGVPVINEFKYAIDSLIAKHIRELNPINHDLRVLSQICEEYPTVDTFAKLLYVTKSPTFTNYPNIDYDKLKRLLSIFLLLSQEVRTRDSRYDGFIASVIKDNGEFPPMTILSWNYDAQFEMAYSGYADEGRYIPILWKKLNVLHKTYNTSFDVTKPFAMVKLNGTAFFVEKDENRTLIDLFFGGYKSDRERYQQAVKFYNDSERYENTLSYVWEKENRGQIIKVSQERVKNTRTLIVIGYSFPYVNREIDEQIIGSMEELRRVVVQDPYPSEIIERIKSMAPSNGRNIEYIAYQNTNQFFIPYSY